MHGGWWEAELRVGHAAHAELCTSASTCSSLVKAYLVSFRWTAVALLALVEASENTTKLFCVEMMRFTCISCVVWLCSAA